MTSPSLGPMPHQDRDYGLAFAVPVVAPEVAGVGGDLVHIGHRRFRLAFHFDDHHRTVHEEDAVRATGFHRHHIFENGAVGTGRTVTR
jgi:hypothetical protein